MQLKIKPYSKNTYPLSGFLIKNASVKAWIVELQRLNFSLEEVEVYPIPNTVNTDNFNFVVIYCQPFGIPFGVCSFE